jgi:predicted ATPase
MNKLLHRGRPLEDGARGQVTFLLGENGSGKSRELRRLAISFAKTGTRTIAISNTIFDRFPTRQPNNYFRLSPARGKGYAQRALKQALISSDDEKRDARLVGRTLLYAGFESEVGVKPIFSKMLNVQEAIGRLRGSYAIPPQDVSLIVRAIERSVVLASDGQDELTWFRLEQSDPAREVSALVALIKYESTLTKLKILTRVTLFLRKNAKVLALDQASSGELSLIATYAFLATRMSEGAVVLVDEPENSLHPRWQSEYCGRLLDLFYLYEPRIFLASHSPMIVSGAESQQISIRIVTLPPEAREGDSDARSIDGILLEAFGVLAPASHYLSEKVTGLLNDLSLGQTTLETVTRELERLSLRSYDAQQKEFLSGAVSLAETVEHESKSLKDSDEG